MLGSLWQDRTLDLAAEPVRRGRGTVGAAGLAQLFLAAAVVLAIPEGEATAETVAGVTAGALAVDASGSASYSIPIAVPPGVAGMQPDLSLTYSSMADNGTLGVGWSLGGLSIIHRCPRTLAQDNVAGGVKFDADDRFCLDGQRLIAISGAYGADGTEYRTEIDSFSRVISHGTAGSGPAYFTVETKAGQTMEYGATTDSRVPIPGRSEARFWALNRVEDTVGNYMTLHYWHDWTTDDTCRIDRIEYAGNTAAGTSPQSSVQFLYEVRPDPRETYQVGARINMSHRLTGIQASTGSTLVHDYRFAYDQSPATGRSRLRSVTECDGSGDCLAPTAFDWNPDPEGWAADPAWALPTHIFTIRDLGGTHQLGDVVDINGDGLPDMVRANSGNEAARVTYMNSGSGWVVDPLFQLPVNLFSNSRQPPRNNKVGEFIDVNGDGRSDFVHIDKRVWLSTTSGWTASAQYELPELVRTISGNTYYTRGDFVDVNGDGLVDWMTSYRNGTGDQITTFLNTGAGWSEAPALAMPDVAYDHTTNPPQQRGAFVDLDGDGLLDWIRAFNDAANNTAFLNTGSGWVESPAHALPEIVRRYSGSQAFENGSFLDVNGDGLLDWVRAYQDGSGSYRATFLNTGAGWLESAQHTLPTVMRQHHTSPQREVGRFIEANGDGLVDWAYAFGSSRTTYLNNGNGWVESPIHRAPAPVGYINEGRLYRPGLSADIDGDGLDDWLTALRPRAGSSSRVTWINGSNGPEFVTGITDSLGRTTTITYAPMTDGAVYTKGSGAVFPEQEVQGSVHVVQEVSKDDGLGGQARMTYDYEGARVDLQGRGFLGFARMTSVDEQTGIKTVTDYRQGFPFIGRVEFTDTRLADGTLVKLVADTWDEKPLNGGLTTFPFVAQSQAQSFEVNDGPGNLAITTITTTNVYDDFGNPTSIVATTAGGGETFKKTTTNSYTNDTVKWFLGRLTRATVKSELPDLTSATRVSAFDYDPATGLLRQEVVEPDLPAFKLTTDYGHDLFGNVTSKTVSGGDIVTRTTTTEFSTDGRFAIKVTNDLGHAESHAHDPRFGTATSLTGPNLITTTWDFDGFGRKTREARADGTETRTSYELCVTQCPAGGVYAVVQQDLNSASQTPIGPRAVEYYDTLNRVFRSETEGFDGTKIFVDTEFNARGETVSVTRPYFQGAADADIQKIVTTFDGIGRPLSVTQPDGGVTTSDYGGLTTTSTNALNQIEIRRNDAIGQLVEASDNLGTKVTYKHDPFGNLEETDAGGVVTTMIHDIRGRKTSMVDPDMGSWIYGYNVLGELTSQTDAENQSVTLEYDTLGRMKRRVEPEGTTEWVYDTAAKGIGKLHSITAPGGYLQTQSYDSLGRPSATTTTIDGVNYSSSVTYDGAGRVETQAYPSGFTVRNTYNLRGYLASVSEDGGSAVYWQADSVNAEGQVTQATLGNGVVTTKAFDPKTALVDSIVTTLGATVVQDLTYGFDKLGNLKQRADLRQDRREDFLYDGLNRLVTATLTDSGAGGGTLAASSYSYNAIGNLTFKSDVGNLSYGGGGAGPHAVTAGGGKGYVYDANGNMTARLAEGESGLCAPAINALSTATEDSLGSAITLANYTVPDLTNRILVVATSSDNADQWGGLPASVTFGTGHSLTQADAINTNFAGPASTSSVWYLIDPPAETGDIVVSYGDESGSRGVSAYVLDCVAQQGPEATATGGDDDPFIKTSITPLTAGAIVIDATAYNFDSEPLNVTEGPDQVQTYNANIPGGHMHLGSRRLVDPAAPVDLGWDGTDELVHRWAQVLVAFAPAGAPPGGATAEQTVAWSSFNKPVLITDTTNGNEAGFTYGPNRARIQQRIVENSIAREVVYVGGLYERRTRFGSPDELVHYISAGGTVAIFTIYDDNLPATNKARYLHRDHLGSIDSITGETGAVVERLSFDAHGKRRLADWTAGDPVSPDAETPRGFTGHEHLDSVGLIHMNGRVYDPTIGRFLSADPLIQAPEDTQSFNRYSYVRNNPLSYTDPSGFFFKKIKKLLSKIAKFHLTIARVHFDPYYQHKVTMKALQNPWVRLAVQVALAFVPGPWAILASAAFAGLATYANGGSLTDSLISAGIAAGTAGAFFGVGEGFSAIPAGTMSPVAKHVAKTVAHGVVGGVSSHLQGGKFHHGFAAAGVAQFAAPAINALGRIRGPQGIVARTAASATVGGVGAQLGGGKFVNGATTGAFSYLFNEAMHQIRKLPGTRVQDLDADHLADKTQLAKDPRGGSHACETGFYVCVENGHRLYDKGYVEESNYLYRECRRTLQMCYNNEDLVQTLPRVREAETYFPPEKSRNGGGYVHHWKGKRPVFIPPSSDPIGELPPKNGL